MKERTSAVSLGLDRTGALRGGGTAERMALAHSGSAHAQLAGDGPDRQPEVEVVVEDKPPSPDEGPGWWTVALAGAAGFVPAAVVGTMVLGGLILGRGTANPDVVYNQFQVENASGAVARIFQALLLGGLILSGFARRRLPILLVVVGGLDAVLAVVGIGAVASVRSVWTVPATTAPAGFALWSLMAAIWLLRAKPRRRGGRLTSLAKSGSRGSRGCLLRGDAA